MAEWLPTLFGDDEVLSSNTDLTKCVGWVAYRLRLILDKRDPPAYHSINTK